MLYTIAIEFNIVAIEPTYLQCKILPAHDAFVTKHFLQRFAAFVAIGSISPKISVSHLVKSRGARELSMALF